MLKLWGGIHFTNPIYSMNTPMLSPVLGHHPLPSRCYISHFWWWLSSYHGIISINCLSGGWGRYVWREMGDKWLSRYLMSSYFPGDKCSQKLTFFFIPSLNFFNLIISSHHIQLFIHDCHHFSSYVSRNDRIVLFINLSLSLFWQFCLLKESFMMQI